MIQAPTATPLQGNAPQGYEQPIGLEHYVYTLAYPEDMGGYVFYVGKGKDDRVDDHEREAKRGIKGHKCNAIRKIWRIGGQVVKTKVAFFVTHEEALLFERALIMLMRPYGHLTNLTDGGDGVVGQAFSEEYRRKMSEAHKGKKPSEEHRRRLSEAIKISPLAQKHRYRLAESRKGKKPSEETRHKISEAKKGKKPSEEDLRKVSEGLKLHYAQLRAQALAKMRYPVISSTDASWKQGVVQALLWEVGA